MSRSRYPSRLYLFRGGFYGLLSILQGTDDAKRSFRYCSSACYPCVALLISPTGFTPLRLSHLSNPSLCQCCVPDNPNTMRLHEQERTLRKNVLPPPSREKDGGIITTRTTFALRTYLIVHNPKMGNSSIANMLVNTARPMCNPWPLAFPPSSCSMRGYVWLTLLLSGNLYLLCTVITKLYHNAMFPPSVTDLVRPRRSLDGRLAGRME
jgi:hypothetical protein